MYIPRLESSCRYDVIGEMICHWLMPEDFDTTSVYRLKINREPSCLSYQREASDFKHITRFVHLTALEETIDQHAAVLPMGETVPVLTTGLMFVVLCMVCGLIRLFYRSGRITLS